MIAPRRRCFLSCIPFILLFACGKAIRISPSGEQRNVLDQNIEASAPAPATEAMGPEAAQPGKNSAVAGKGDSSGTTATSDPEAPSAPIDNVVVLELIPTDEAPLEEKTLFGTQSMEDLCSSWAAQLKVIDETKALRCGGVSIGPTCEDARLAEQGYYDCLLAERGEEKCKVKKSAYRAAVANYQNCVIKRTVGVSDCESITGELMNQCQLFKNQCSQESACG